MHARLFIFLTVFFCFNCSVMASPARQLELKSNYPASVQKMDLSHEEIRFLTRKTRLVVGTWLPEISPIVYESRQADYRGVNADYLALLQKSLNIKITIKQYGNEHDALDALSRNEVDALLTQLSQQDNVDSQLQRTSALIKTWPTLVTSLKNTMLPLTTHKRVTLACARDCAFLDVIGNAFPNAQITLYDNEQQAMLSVATGKNQYFIGNNITASYFITKYFSQSLVITHYYNKQQQYNYFLTSVNQPLLQNILNRFITSMDNETRMRVMDNWLNRGNLAYLNTPVPMSLEENRWIQQKHRVRLLINPDYPPYTLVDHDGELRGIMGDLLNIIQLQTGIEFEPITVNSSSEKLKYIASGKWDMYITIPHNNEPTENTAISEPITNVSFVIVSNRNEAADALRAYPLRIALPVRHILANDLKQHYPKATWVNVDNDSIALEMVRSGEVDAAVTTELLARYMIDHYYSQNMHYTLLTGMPPVSMNFAIAGEQPELKSILNKALNAIPPREILQMTERWSKISNIQKDTWHLYSKQFYHLAIFTLVLFAIIFGWGLSLSREVRKRRQSQCLLEEQLQLKEALSHELEAEKDKAIQATKAKSRFLASMSHELRTPVSSIVGFLELLSSPELSSGQRKEAIELAGVTAQSLLELIGKILDVDKIECGKYQLAPQWTDLSQLINMQCHSFDALAKQKGIALRIDSDLDVNERVFIDLQALRQVLTNLVGNALKFTEQGYIQVAAHLTPKDDKHSTLVVTVSDTGCGISQEDQATLFHRYAQARQGRQQTGSGLGLVICKELVTLMGGTLEMSSRPGEGTTFTITLPVETARQSLKPTPDAPDVALSLPHLSILIADDHPTNRLLLKRQLNAIGYSVDEACDGEEAEAKIDKKRYDLLITDVNMPKKDGLALAASLRRKYEHLQIWGLTASALSQSSDQCLQSGMNLCLFKPVSMQTLSEKLSQIRINHTFSCATRHLKLNVLTENTGGDRVLMNEILETFREASTNDIQAAQHAVDHQESQAFLRALHRLHGSAQILEITALQQLCEPFESLRGDVLQKALCQQELQKIITIMKEIEIEIDGLISH